MIAEEHLAPPGLPRAHYLPGTTNAVAFSIDYSLVSDFEGPLRTKGDGMSVAYPDWHSDIAWIGPAKEHGYRRYERYFEALRIPERAGPMLNIDRTVRLYGGFLVTRSRCRQPVFHTDFKNTGGRGMTMITPVGEAPPHFGLLYHGDDGRIRTYEYRRGEAIMFTEDFVHSTRPGEAAQPVVLLSFNFGTDQMDAWPAIQGTSGYQANLVCRPDGKFERLLWRLYLKRSAVRLARRLGFRKTA